MIVSYNYETADGYYVHETIEYSESSTLSTNATADDLPEPGRIIDTYIYQAYGKKLENLLGVIGHKLGFGPMAAYEQILRILERGADNTQTKSWKSKVVKRFRPSEEWKVAENCKTLLKCTHSDILINQRNALDSIMQIAVMHPEIQETFRQLNAPIILDSLPHLIISSHYATSDRDSLLSASRKALLSTDSPFSGLYKDACYLMDQNILSHGRLTLFTFLDLLAELNRVMSASIHYLKTVELHFSTVRGRNMAYYDVVCAQVENICNKYEGGLCVIDLRLRKIQLTLDKLRSLLKLDRILIDVRLTSQHANMSLMNISIITTAH